MFDKALAPDLLQTLLFVAEEGNLTAAGRRLLLTQQAVSAQIKRLEALTGRQLLIRSSHMVKLTQEGEAILVYARQIAEISDRIRAHLSAAQLGQCIRIGCVPGFGPAGQLPFLSAFKRLRPYVQISFEFMKTDALIRKLEGGHLDIIIGAQPKGESQGEVLCRDRLEWVGDIRNLVRPGEPIPLVLLPKPSLMRDIIFNALIAADETWTVCFESDDHQIQKMAVLAGWGISATPAALSRNDWFDMSNMRSDLLPDLGEIEFFIKRRYENTAISNFFYELSRETCRALSNTVEFTTVNRNPDK